MPLFQPANDFEELIDGLEPVILRRRGSSQRLSISAAYRRQIETQESQPSKGATLQADATWHLQLPAGESNPSVGDIVVDKQTHCWTILETEQLALLGRWKCKTRELRIAYGCRDRVDVERPQWGDNGGGPEIVDWTTVFTALLVKIQPDESMLNATANPPEKSFRYQVILSESIALEPGDRFLAEDGTSYRVQSLEQAEHIDALPVATVLREQQS